MSGGVTYLSLLVLFSCFRVYAYRRFLLLRLCGRCCYKCDCPSTLGERPCEPADGSVLALLRGPGGVFGCGPGSMSLELICSLSSSGYWCNQSSVYYEFMAGLAKSHHANTCKHLTGERWIDPNTWRLLYRFPRRCVSVSGFLRMATQHRLSLVHRGGALTGGSHYSRDLTISLFFYFNDGRWKVRVLFPPRFSERIYWVLAKPHVASHHSSSVEGVVLFSWTKIVAWRRRKEYRV